jgi:hypothetical protein
MKKIYDLREDDERIAQVQRATLTTKDFGLEPEHGLFGSAEWWRAISDGRIPMHSVNGVISRVFLSGHNDWEEFAIESSGEQTSWNRVTSGGPAGSPGRVAKGRMYEVGRRVLLKYVLQQSRLRLPARKAVLEIWIGDRSIPTCR